MKTFLAIIILCFISNITYSQKNIVRAEFKYIFDIWKPWTEQAAIYQDTTGNISSSAWSFNLQTEIIDKPKWGLSTGFTYKKLKYTVKDRIYNWNYTVDKVTVGQFYVDTFYRIFTDPADLNAESNSFGITIDGCYNILERTNVKGSIGINTEIYFLEYYNAWYSSSDFTSIDRPESIPDALDGPLRKLILSSINTSIFYRTTYYLPKHLSIGLKASIGTNVYSDWDQFKRNAWIGLGIELGFWNK